MTVKYDESNVEGISEETQMILNEYFSNLKLANRSESTIKKYKNILERYLGRCPVSLESLTTMDAYKIFAELTADKKAGTKKSYFLCLTSFFRFCFQEGYIKGAIITKTWMPKLPHHYLNT